jgi:hypothetical protein
MTPTTSGNQSSIQLSGATQPTLGPKVDQRNTQPHFTDQHDRQNLPVSYSHHPILDLEVLIGDLSERGARIASLLFALVREDHDRSGNYVEGLSRLFAPTRNRLDTERAVAEQKMVAFDEAERDVVKYEAFVGDLDDTAAGNPRALVHLVQGNLKDNLEISRPLNDVFSPLEQRYINEHAATSTFRGVLERLDNSVNHNGHDAAQPT